MPLIKLRYHYGLYELEKIPRKAKKALIGLRMSSCKLKRLLKSVKVVETFPTMYERPNITPYLFCPYCGCTYYTQTGNMTSYPEHWEYFNCLRCKAKVVEIDNSPFIHILEYVKNGVLQDKYFK